MPRTLRDRAIYAMRAVVSVPLRGEDRAMCKEYCIAGGFRRLYHYHVRKTGGTSVNNAFFALGGGDPKQIAQHISGVRVLLRRKVRNGLIFVGWDRYLIEQGRYYFAHSHLPMHEVSLPEKTFTITCLRNPVKRVLSLYGMLCMFRDRHIPHPCMRVEGKWLGRSLGEFIRKIPQHELLGQLYMFSKRCDVNEAFDSVAQCNEVLCSETLDSGLESLGRRLGLKLERRHDRMAELPVEITAHDRTDLERLLDPEMRFYEMVTSKLRRGSGRI